MTSAPPATSPLSAVSGLSAAFLRAHAVCPLRRDGDRLVIGIAGEPPAGAIDELSLAYGCETVTEQISSEALEAGISQLLALSSSDSPWREQRDGSNDEIEANAELRALAMQAPVVRYVNVLIRDAALRRASDIHVERQRDGSLRVRWRVDGVLGDAPPPPQPLAAAVISRIKLLADLDIAERRRPQDGRVRIRLDDGSLDMRIATAPSLHGESVVIRLLDRGGRPSELAALGMPASVESAFGRLSTRSRGLILVTGPTGSGKTTTLYAALVARRTDLEKVVTIEDPVEYELPGVVQVPVHGATGITMGSVLRAILRQDPDVIMVGEMRDRETAELAVQAALTGHLVLSTLHTNSAVGTIVRLRDLGIPTYLIATALTGVLAQRLLRVICEACGGSGCSDCRESGFSGRVGVFELLVVDEGIRDAIARDAGRAELEALATAGGMVPLSEAAGLLVHESRTTLAEVGRVIGD